MKITNNTLELAQQIKHMPDIFETSRLLPYSQEPVIDPCHETSEFTPPYDKIFL
jgi:hypothetical protein